MLKSLRTIFALLVLVAAAALAMPAFAQQSAGPDESPRAMSAATAVPQGAATLSAGQIAAQKEAEKGTPEQQELARKLVDAVYSRDLTAMKRLIAPSVLKCVGQDKDRQEFLDNRIKKQFGLPINKNYRLIVTKLDSVSKPSKYVTFPMRPTYLMGMEFDTQDGGTATVNRMIGQEDGNWYEAQPCPTELGMQRFAKQQQSRAAGRAKAKAATAQVKEPLKSQLLALIAKRDDADAWKLCMSSMHVDFQTARGIVGILSGDEAD